MKCSILMLILSTLRKNVFFATEPGMTKVEIVKLAEDRGMYSLPSLQEYVIYAVGQGTLKLGSAGHVEEAAGLFSEERKCLHPGDCSIVALNNATLCRISKIYASLLNGDYSMPGNSFYEICPEFSGKSPFFFCLARTSSLFSSGRQSKQVS
jgi:hypothetical protein